MDNFLKEKVQEIPWNKVSESGSAISLNQIFHPDYESTAQAILKIAKVNSDYKTLDDILVPDQVDTEDYKFVLRDFC